MATDGESTERRIVGAVSENGKIYKAGDEAALPGVLTQANIDRLVDKGVLAGDWTPIPAADSTEVAASTTSTLAPALPEAEPEPAPATRRASSAGKPSTKKRK